jgi:iron complex transport system substrate-binding protein
MHSYILKITAGYLQERLQIGFQVTRQIKQSSSYGTLGDIRIFYNFETKAMLKKNIIIIVASGIIVFAGLYFYLKQEKQTGAAVTDTILYTDLAGKRIRIKKNVQRIVLLRSKDIYELSALLGDELPKKLVGWGPDLKTDDRATYDQFIKKYPSLQNIAETGSIYSDGLNPEQILSCRPDLVIADKFILDRGYKYVEKFEAAGLPVVYLDGSNDPLTGSQRGIALLGKILGKEKRAGEIVKYVDDQMNIVFSGIKKIAGPVPSVYLEAGSQGPQDFAQTYGSIGNPPKYTSWGEVLSRLKVRNIAAGVVSMQERINPEFVLKANPDVIIITGQNWTSIPGSMQLGYSTTSAQAKQLLKGFTNRPGWNTLLAVKNKRVYSVFHNCAIILCFAAVQALAKDIHPETFSTLDPESNLKEFYKKFLPIPYSGTWMTGIE